jgi:transposase
MPVRLVSTAGSAPEASRPMAAIGQRPKSDRLAAKVISMVEEEKLSYRIVAKRLDLSKNTVLEIMKRHRRAATTQAAPSI